MSLLNSPLLDNLQRYLDVASFRQGLIAANMANIDTPNYHTVDIDFQTALKTAENQMMPESQVQGALSQDVQPVQGLVQRPDGNNVSIDREGTLMARTELQFNAATSILREEFHRIQMAIQGQ